ncbi:spectrin alpha chain, non-erythrocytic 1-like isoform X1 [Nothobranchius furzeri]|uniref:spectrin alpha chain, non-erythrocytic 1-like isoform X1 n=2 Tax=Nothobranchius furzeri TaxID=105023 RepID=UPI0039046A44
MAEEAPMVQAQQQEHLGSAPGKTVRLGVQTTANFNSIKELNNCWRSLQQLAEDRSNMLGSAHEVQRFHRDADETKEWIEEKNQALNTDNYGHDLASVQALQREHEDFERDLAALGDKVRFLIGTRTRVVSGDTFFMVLVTPPQPFLISNQRGAFLFKVDGGHNLTPEDCLSFGSNQPLVLPLVFLGLMLFRSVFALILDLPFFRIPVDLIGY